jgi:hypothetical protein
MIFFSFVQISFQNMVPWTDMFHQATKNTTV